MNSVILSTATRLLAPLILAFSIFVLLRGHNEPGGGFIGGLIAAVGYALFAKAAGTAAARRALVVAPGTLAMIGVAMAVIAALYGYVAKDAFLASVWPFLWKDAGGVEQGLPIGSTLLFDAGVFLAVVGAVSGLFLALEEDVERRPEDEES